MTALLNQETEGILFPLALNGELLYQGQEGEIFPAQFTDVPTPIQDHVDTIDGGAQTFQPSFGAGHPDYSERHTFRIPYNSISGPIRRQLERARKMGRVHDFSCWKPNSEFYTSPGSWDVFYLPHYRKNAATWFAALVWAGVEVTTDRFPMRVWLAGVEQTLAYFDGPTLSTPASGTVNVSKNPDATGHVPFKFSAVVPKGQLVELEYFPVFAVTVASVQVVFAKGRQESPTYELQER